MRQKIEVSDNIDAIGKDGATVFLGKDLYRAKHFDVDAILPFILGLMMEVDATEGIVVEPNSHICVRSAIVQVESVGHSTIRHRYLLDLPHHSHLRHFSTIDHQTLFHRILRRHLDLLQRHGHQRSVLIELLAAAAAA